MKNIRFILAIFVVGFLLSACTKPSANQPIVNNQNNMTNEQTSDIQVPGTTPQPEQGTPATYTLSELAQHNNASDCWLVANSNKVYNVTDYISKHPGGDKILNGCGKDMTEFFNTKHMKQSKEQLPAFYIGDLK